MRRRLRGVRRTSVYLTEAQQRTLDQRARRAGTNRSEVLREILDAALAHPASSDDQLQAQFAALADRHDRLVAGLFDADPDLRIDA